ncbi:hypothetical protein [Leadbetterella sp. DM7]|uniref:hypothetical protein n=1 Tax=Leadbetterella sp. DM7 TaxID=3235085 RepID=UPI00349EFC42
MDKKYRVHNSTILTSITQLLFRLYTVKSSLKGFYLFPFLIFLASCDNKDITPKKFIGKWSLSTDYYYEESGGVKKYEGEDKYNPSDESMSLHFTSKDEVLYKLRSQVLTCKYTYTESTKKITIIDKYNLSYVYEVISLNSKQMKLKTSYYSDYANANRVSEKTLVKL